MSQKLPSWTLKLLPVLTENISLQEFEQWIYQADSEKHFPKDVYLELISFDYNDNLSEFVNYLIEFIDSNLGIGSEFFSISEYFSVAGAYYYTEKDDFNLLPISSKLAEYIWDTIEDISQQAYWSEETYDIEYEPKIKILLLHYLKQITYLLQNYEKYTDTFIITELNKIYHFK